MDYVDKTYQTPYISHTLYFSNMICQSKVYHNLSLQLHTSATLPLSFHPLSCNTLFYLFPDTLFNLPLCTFLTLLWLHWSPMKIASSPSNQTKLDLGYSLRVSVIFTGCTFASMRVESTVCRRTFAFRYEDIQLTEARIIQSWCRFRDFLNIFQCLFK